MNQAVIVVDAELKSALSVIRALGRRGIRVIAGSHRPTALGLFSRYVYRRFTYPSPLVDRAAFLRAVKAEAVREGGRPVLYAFSDATWLTIYEARDDLAEALTLKVPEATAVEVAFDKAATYSLARREGLPTIPTTLPETPSDDERLFATVQYPVVMKARRSVTWRNNQGVFGSVTFIHSESDLRRALPAHRERYGESPLIQTLVRGEEYGVEFFAVAGVPQAVVVHRRLRSLSPTGGASVLKETVGPSDQSHLLISYSETLVKALAWTGPVMVEWKVDADTRTPYLMEVNGRWWGSLPLSVAAGVDFPTLAYDYAVSGVLTNPPLQGRAGVITRHFWGDGWHLLRVLWARDPLRASQYPSRRQALRDFFRVPPGTRGDIADRTDPLPVLAEVIDILTRTWK
jgi:predicted ATP-grasp superfamily ATP-dependent carboligase